MAISFSKRIFGGSTPHKALLSNTAVEEFQANVKDLVERTISKTQPMEKLREDFEGCLKRYHELKESINKLDGPKIICLETRLGVLRDVFEAENHEKEKHTQKKVKLTLPSAPHQAATFLPTRANLLLPKLQGIKNSGNDCGFISVYQMLARMRGVLPSLPGRLATWKDFDATNRDSKRLRGDLLSLPGCQLDKKNEKKQEDASEILLTLFSQFSYPHTLSCINHLEFDLSPIDEAFRAGFDRKKRS